MQRCSSQYLGRHVSANTPVDIKDQFAEKLFVWHCLDSRRGRSDKQELRHRIKIRSHATDMLKTLCATVDQGKIELSLPVVLPEGVRVLVTVLPDDEKQFWIDANKTSPDAVWDNTEDEVYAQILLA